jgi:hypothetical protein
MGKLGVQKGAEHAPLRGPCVEEQRSGSVIAYLHHLGRPVWKFRTQLHGEASQEVQDPVAQGGIQTQVPELNDELGGYYGVEG